ncbi:thioesterase II family protein [Iodobacter arcticus]|uniref:Thioesterase II family protein n=1 Tax=Iodobacter arcticus TaxID=590593 RepID=A0ABW2QYB4_9NEIS
MVKAKIFTIPKPRIAPKLRVFCFPFAGGSFTTYIPWVHCLNDDVELVLITLPGRASRVSEPSHEQMESIISELLGQKSIFAHVPYIFFGHSLGSRVAFELAVNLQSLGITAPQYFIASGSRAPHLESRRESIHHLPKAEFLQKLGELNGTPKEVLSNSELIDFFIPALRADFKVAHDYRAKKIPIVSPILVLGGEDDIDVTHLELLAWMELSQRGTQITLIPGGHFFINEHQSAVIEQVDFVVNLVLTCNEIQHIDKCELSQ